MVDVQKAGEGLVPVTSCTQRRSTLLPGARLPWSIRGMESRSYSAVGVLWQHSIPFPPLSLVDKLRSLPATLERETLSARIYNAPHAQSVHTCGCNCP